MHMHTSALMAAKTHGGLKLVHSSTIYDIYKVSTCT